jgi:uncharacterized repeat protein (TIGR03806 family)
MVRLLVHRQASWTFADSPSPSRENKLGSDFEHRKASVSVATGSPCQPAAVEDRDPRPARRIPQARDASSPDARYHQQVRSAKLFAGGLVTMLAGCGASTGTPSGLDERPRNTTCLAPATPEGMPSQIGATGCFDPSDLRRPATGLIPYDVIAPLWSDGAAKQRYLALPDSGSITVDDSGDFDFPPGTVLAKLFLLSDVPIETRLFVRHGNGVWAGYSYRFSDDGADAQLVGADGDYRLLGTQEWQFPSRQHCLDCHTEAAGLSLGLELAQLDRPFAYPNGRTANQLTTFDAIGLFSGGMRPGDIAALPDPHDPEAAIGARARAYLHSNCANCHRPGGTREPNVSMDLRFSTALSATTTCDARPNRTDLGLAEAKLLFPGNPALSILSLRMQTLVASLRMPPVASSVLDGEGVGLIDEWIRGLSCVE